MEVLLINVLSFMWLVLVYKETISKSELQVYNPNESLQSREKHLCKIWPTDMISDYTI